MASFRRYTTLAPLLDILRKRELTLLSPDSWVDRNDVLFLEEYRKRSKVGSVLALCFSTALETYHHWHVFGRTPEAVCIKFDRATLLAELPKGDDIVHGHVEYVKLRDAKQIEEVALDRLPFLKRRAFADEQEYRIVMKKRADGIRSSSVGFPLDAITKIRLSPWLPKPLFEAVERSIRDAGLPQRIKVARSSLVDSPAFQRLLDR